MSKVTACAEYVRFSHAHTQCPPSLVRNMATERTALLGDRHRPPTSPEESIHLRPNHTTINCDSKPEISHNETSVLSQGTDYAMLTGASNTVDIHDLLETLERASSIVKSHIQQQNGGHSSRKR